MPSGLNATPDDTFVPDKRITDTLPSVGVPQKERVVGAAGDQAVAVWAERHAVHGIGVARQRFADQLPCVSVPDAHGFVAGAGA
ncbi:hypothetical protein MPSYJ_55490 [Mycolicibacterium psychrotolerans]|uniref:Uncharacterized protein n=1 Tax=Mycolicibacterium psychrotolerans TaxID=216929 RepID=A0A7I7MIT2_9MYCO|nr:hypothetical protein MPSYJ_55490 [Mycolicibacterium psychrotolerans]